MISTPSLEDKALPSLAWFFRVDVDRLRAAYTNGEDLYSFIVTERMEETTEQEMRMYRRAVKELSHGLLYGAGPEVLQEVKVEVDYKKAEELVCAYYTSFPQISGFIKRIKEENENDGKSDRPNNAS